MEWLGYPVVDSYEGLDISGLPLNHAWVTINTSVDNVSIYSMRDDCFNCPYKLEKHLQPNKSEAWQVDTSVQMSWRVVRTNTAVDYMSNNNRKGWLCEMRPTLHEYGVYRLSIGRCAVKTEVPGVHTYYPLLLCSLILVGASMIYSFINYMRSKRLRRGDIREKVLHITEEINEDSQHSVYVFRGLLLSLIIFATTGGGGYPIFNNTWSGLSLAEGLFFAYVWSIGMFIPTVMDQALKQKSKCAIVKDIFVRAFILVFIGTLIDSTVGRSLWATSIWCPLQRMGIAYFIAATAYVFTVQRFEMKSKMIICKAISNLITLMWCWIITGFLLAIFIISISTFLSFNCLGNIGLEEQRADYSNIKTEVTQNCNNNFTEYANKLFAGESVKMANVNGYIGIRGGALGVLSSILYMMIGLKAGVVYLNYKTNSDRLKLWGLWAILFGLGGICFAVVSYRLDFNMWPVASILLISSAALHVFVIVHLITEVWSFQSQILSSLGVTSLVILSAHLLFSSSLPFNWQIYFNNHILYLLQNFWMIFLWFIIGVVLFRKNVKFEL